MRSFHFKDGCVQVLFVQTFGSLVHVLMLAIHTINRVLELILAMSLLMGRSLRGIVVLGHLDGD